MKMLVPSDSTTPKQEQNISVEISSQSGSLEVKSSQVDPHVLITLFRGFTIDFSTAGKLSGR